MFQTASGDVGELIAAVVSRMTSDLALAGAVAFLLGLLVRTLFDRSVKRDIARLSAGLARLDRIEAALTVQRGQAYGEIWSLTGAFNLFGPETRPNLRTLTRQMSDWYFAHGQMLTGDAQKHYFIVQEALMFCQLKQIIPERPDDAQLYAGEAGIRTPEQLSTLFDLATTDPALEKGKEDTPVEYALKHFGAIFDQWKAWAGQALSKKKGKEDAALKHLGTILDQWKALAGQALSELPPEVRAWLVLQRLLSRFRTRLSEEMRSRDPIKGGAGGA